MGSQTSAYSVFHMVIFIVLVIVYALLVFYIIPEFVEHDKKDMASKYTGYAFWVATSLLTFGSMLTKYIEKNRVDTPSPVATAGSSRSKTVGRR